MASRGKKSIEVPVPIEAFWATITDYLAYPQILDEIKTSRIVERDAGGAVVAFEIRVLFKRFDYVLRLTEEAPTRLSWSLESSSTLAQNDGGWELEALGPELTRVTYWNELAARSFLPKSFINALARIALPSMLRRWSRYAQQHRA